MIAANELRIGNLAYNQYGKIGTVWGFKVGDATHDFEHIVSFKELNVNSCYSRYIKPIPLTTEILEKCGFVKPTKNDNHGGLLVSIGNDVSIRLKPLISGDGYYWDNFNGAYKVIIKHLHQLQNLYWCLTGEEINYTP